jgi:hypothetical protein
MISINSNIFEQSQVYNLYLGDTTISFNYVEVLTLHPTSSEYGFIEVCDSTHTRNLKKIVSHPRLIQRRVY